jgi:hypothetical protein
VMWLDDVPKESESDSVEFRPNNEDEEDWWLQVKKPTFSEPPPLPESLTARIDPEQLRDSSLEAPGFKESRRKTDVGGGVESAEYAAIKVEFQRYVTEKWKPWAEQDKKKRSVLRIYTDLFSLYQQQKELGEAYEVILAIGQLRWIPKPGVEVNRHIVAVQTSIEFDSQKGVITVSPAAEGAKPRLEEDMLELDERPAPDVLTSLEEQVSKCDDDIWRNDQMINALKSFVHSIGGGDGSYSDDLKPIEHATTAPSRDCCRFTGEFWKISKSGRTFRRAFCRCWKWVGRGASTRKPRSWAPTARASWSFHCIPMKNSARSSPS